MLQKTLSRVKEELPGGFSSGISQLNQFYQHYLQGGQEKGKDSAQDGVDGGRGDEREDWDRREKTVVGSEEA